MKNVYRVFSDAQNVHVAAAPIGDKQKGSPDEEDESLPELDYPVISQI